MEWKLSLSRKIKTGAALTVVFLLVLATNLMDRSHFTIVQKSLTTVYKDRLLANDYIYKIARQLQNKEGAMKIIDRERLSKINSSVNDSIQALIARYASTELTENEEVRFESLKKNLDRLIRHESKRPVNMSIGRRLPSFKSKENYLYEIYEDLDALSKIQLEESNREISYSNRIINTSNLVSRLEIGVLIIIGLLIQMLIFVKPLK